MKKAHCIKWIGVLLSVSVLLMGFLLFGLQKPTAKERLRPGRFETKLVQAPKEDRQNGISYFLDTDLDASSYLLREGKPAIVKGTLPTSYNAYDKGVVTSAKNQNDTGCCWAFSIASCAETDCIQNEGWEPESADFSEWGLAYFLFHPVNDPLGLLLNDGIRIVSNSSYLTIGGNFFMGSMELANRKGILNESVAPWETVIADRNAKPDDDMAYSDAAILENSYILPINTQNDREAVKQAIIDYGSVGVPLYFDTYYMNTQTYAYYGASSDQNHAVTIIGWDDNYSRMNFRSSYRPMRDGAWLVMNSWGPKWGLNGCYWVSYDDPSVRATYGHAFDMVPTDTYDCTYQYDGADDTQFLLSEDVHSAKVACVYESQHDETIEAVSTFYMNDAGGTYTAQVYLNPTSKDNPQTGTLKATETGTFPCDGYYTTHLKNPVSVKKGEKFSVVYTITIPSTDNGGVIFMGAYDESYYPFEVINDCEYGQGYSFDNDGWVDWAGIEGGASPRVHAMTKLVRSPAPATPTAPTIQTVTDTTIMVVGESLDMEYSLNGRTWQTSETFTGLIPKTEYTVYRRYALTDDHLQSESSAPTIVTTCQSLGECEVKVASSLRFTGAALKPTVTIKDPDGANLTEGTDFTVTYQNNTAVGEATVLVEGNGNYYGTLQKTFSIYQVSIEDVDVYEIPSQAYTGSPLTPSVKLTYGNELLLEGKDYTVSYEKNVYGPKASVIISGIGGFYGKKILLFAIDGAPEVDCIFGDVNDDQVVDMKDVLLLRKYLASMASTINFRNSDTNEDSFVDMKDVLLIRKYLAELIPELPQEI